MAATPREGLQDQQEPVGPADYCDAYCPGAWSERCDWTQCPRRPRRADAGSGTP